MWSEAVEYLKDAQLVAKIQKRFGVEVRYIENSKGNGNGGRRESEPGGQKGLRESVVDNEKKATRDCNVAKRKTNTIVASSEIQDGELCDSQNSNYRIRNHFWYYLFLFGTELGDEVFYSAFIPFWFWNVDGAVGRRVVLVWAIVMTVGQALKDVICWPRPACPPAVRLQSKWSQEYGMPSTHAMIGISIPFSVLLFTMNRYIYPLYLGWTIAFLWCMLVCMSRLYLGMHTVLDILVGLILAILLMIVLVPLTDITDRYIVSNVWALTTLVGVSVCTIVYYPRGERWTPTRGDTTMVVSVTAGVHVGAWLNYWTGAMSAPALPPPYRVIWPSYSMLGRMILRTILGFCSVIATKAIFKSLSYATMCAILKVNPTELMESEYYLENRNKILVDLVYKYITCFMIGVNTVYLLPNVFSMIGIERPTFYTEM